MGFCSASTTVLEYNSDYDFPPAGLLWLPRLGFLCAKDITGTSMGGRNYTFIAHIYGKAKALWRTTTKKTKASTIYAFI